MTSFRKVEAGQPVYLVDRKTSWEAGTGQQATDMITFRCANELCDNFFPLKVSDLTHVKMEICRTNILGKYKRKSHCLSTRGLRLEN